MEEEELGNDLVDTVTSAFPDYERLSFIANESIMFRHKCLTDWAEESKFPKIDGDLSIDELEQYNIDFITKSDSIMTNLSYARASFELAKLQYSRNLNATKAIILEERRAAGARAPGAEVLEGMARTRIMDDYAAYKLAEMILEFWKTMYDKLRLIDNRLTGMNILRNVESKYAVHS